MLTRNRDSVKALVLRVSRYCLTRISMPLGLNGLEELVARLVVASKVCGRVRSSIEL